MRVRLAMALISVSALFFVSVLSAHAEAGGLSGKFMSALRLGADRPVLVTRPAIRQHLSLDDGDEAQFRAAVVEEHVRTTNRKNHINSLLVNPPDTSQDLLPLDQVLVYMLKNNPDIGIAYWQTEDSRHAIRSAKAARLPSVNISALAGPENVNSGSSAIPTEGLIRQEVSVRLSQLLFDFGKTSQAIKRARALNQSATLLQKDVVEDTVLRTAQVYLSLLSVGQVLANSRQNVTAHEEIYDLVRISGEGGNAPEADVKRALTRLDRARTSMIDIENQREAAIGAFRQVTGLEPGTLIEPDFDVSAAYELRAEIVDDILSDNPAMQSALRDTNALKHQVKASKRANLPDINIELNAKHQERVLGDNPWQNEARAVVSVSWNAYDGGASGAVTRQLKARERENRQRIIKLRNELKEEVFNVLSVLKTSRDKTAIFEDQVAASEQVVDLYFMQFQAGQRTLLELLDAQADLSTARNEQTANKYDALSASFASLRFQNKLTSSLTAQIDKIDIDQLSSHSDKSGRLCRGVTGGVARAMLGKCKRHSGASIAESRSSKAEKAASGDHDASAPVTDDLLTGGNSAIAAGTGPGDGLSRDILAPAAAPLGIAGVADRDGPDEGLSDGVLPSGRMPDDTRGVDIGEDLSGGWHGAPEPEGGLTEEIDAETLNRQRLE